jgi:hypothetical protein
MANRGTISTWKAQEASAEGSILYPSRTAGHLVEAVC